MFKFVLPATIMLTAFAPQWARAVPLPAVTAASPNPNVIEVYGGCGIYAHRGPYGACRPGGQAGGYVPGYACPPGFHVGPYGRHCWPN